MQREIKFRGKTLSGGFVYGDLLHYTNPYEGDKVNNGCIIVTEYKSDKDNSFKIVDPETIGQFTGLYDKNGKDIYEGDIIIFDNHLQGISQVVYDYAGFDVDSKTYRTALRPMMNNHMRVVGNIHDNPELLKGGAE